MKKEPNALPNDAPRRRLALGSYLNIKVTSERLMNGKNVRNLFIRMTEKMLINTDQNCSNR